MNNAKSKGNFIDGSWRQGSGAKMASWDPAYEKPLWLGHEAGDEQVTEALAAARKAAPTWASLALKKREALLLRYRTLLEEEKEWLAATISQETGKPLWEARTEVTAMIAKVTISQQAQGERCHQASISKATTTFSTRHKPLGVLAVIGPFNFPGHLPNGHIVPALLAGNSVVFKASEETPLTAERMIALWERADLPRGVLNLVQGGSGVGRALADASEIDGLLFTGSYATGVTLTKMFSNKPGKLLALEMGGNNPLVVASISDVDAAVYHTILSAYLTAGQRCTCARRLIICRDLCPKHFVASLSKAVAKIAIGRYDAQPEPFMGCLINAGAAEKAQKKYNQLLSLGATELVPLRQGSPGPAFVTPGLLDVTNLDASLPDEEIFAPLLQLTIVDSLDQALEVANNTQYGLSAGILSDNRDEYETFYKNIRAGIVNWNQPLTGASSAAPFGGVGKSGNFRPSAFYAADYCNYPVASMESDTLQLPEQPLPGLTEYTHRTQGS